MSATPPTAAICLLAFSAFLLTGTFALSQVGGRPEGPDYKLIVQFTKPVDLPDPQWTAQVQVWLTQYLRWELKAREDGDMHAAWQLTPLVVAGYDNGQPRYAPFLMDERDKTRNTWVARFPDFLWAGETYPIFVDITDEDGRAIAMHRQSRANKSSRIIGVVPGQLSRQKDGSIRMLIDCATIAPLTLDEGLALVPRQWIRWEDSHLGHMKKSGAEFVLRMALVRSDSLKKSPDNARLTNNPPAAVETKSAPSGLVGGPSSLIIVSDGAAMRKRGWHWQALDVALESAEAQKQDVIVAYGAADGLDTLGEFSGSSTRAQMMREARKKLGLLPARSSTQNLVKLLAAARQRSKDKRPRAAVVATTEWTFLSDQSSIDVLKQIASAFERLDLLLVNTTPDAENPDFQAALQSAFSGMGNVRCVSVYVGSGSDPEKTKQEISKWLRALPIPESPGGINQSPQ